MNLFCTFMQFVASQGAAKIKFKKFQIFKISNFRHCTWMEFSSWYEFKDFRILSTEHEFIILTIESNMLGICILIQFLRIPGSGLSYLHVQSNVFFLQWGHHLATASFECTSSRSHDQSLGTH